MLHVRAAFPYCMFILYIILHANAVCPCFMSMLRAMSTCCMSVSMQLVRHAYLFFMSVLYAKVVGPCFTSFLRVHVSMKHVHAT
jgi:hypothetical protein